MHCLGSFSTNTFRSARRRLRRQKPRRFVARSSCRLLPLSSCSRRRCPLLKARQLSSIHNSSMARRRRASSCKLCKTGSGSGSTGGVWPSNWLAILHLHVATTLDLHSNCRCLCRTSTPWQEVVPESQPTIVEHQPRDAELTRYLKVGSYCGSIMPIPGSSSPPRSRLRPRHSIAERRRSLSCGHVSVYIQSTPTRAHLTQL